MRTGVLRDTNAGTPQGSILSPLLSNVALSVLDEYIAQAPGGPGISRNERAKRRRHGLPNYRLIRYADDWCLMVSGTKDDAEALREEIAGVLSTMGLRLSPEKTLITHIDEGLDFLGWRIQRHRKRGTNRHYVYTYPAKKALKAVMGKVKTRVPAEDTNQPLDALLHPAQPDAAGLVRLLPARRVQRDLRLPALLHVAPGHGDGCGANTAGSPGRSSAAATATADGGRPTARTDAVQPRRGAHDALPLPGHSHPFALADAPHEDDHRSPAGLVESPVR